MPRGVCWNMWNRLNSSTTCENSVWIFHHWKIHHRFSNSLQSRQLDSQFPLNLFSGEVRRCLSLTLKVYLSIDQRKSKGLFCVRVAASFTQWQEWIPFLVTHTHTVSLISHSIALTHCAVASSQACLIGLLFHFLFSSVCVRVCRSVREWQIQMEMGL